MKCVKLSEFLGKPVKLFVKNFLQSIFHNLSVEFLKSREKLKKDILDSSRK